METKICVFEKNNITFVLSKDNNMMINATEMAKIFDKRLDVFLKADHVNEFICELELTPFGGSSTPLMREEILKNVNGVGTWMHRILALKFAAWLSPKFEVWVYSTIEKLLFGKHVERELSLKTTIKLQKEKEVLIKKPQKTGEDFERYMEIETLLSVQKTVRANLTKEVVHEMNDLFENVDEE
jgi:hypothetical protein